MSSLSSRRLWFRTAAASAGAGRDRTLRVMDLNCLAPSLVELSRYRDCDARDLDANTRLQTLKNEIHFFDPDIVCLQELEPEDFSSLLAPAIGLRFAGYYSQHTKGRRLDGTGVLWKKDKFDVVETRTVMPLPYSSWDRHLATAAVVLREKPFKTQSECSEDLKTYVVASSHLVFNLARSDVKFYQICYIVDELYKLKLKYSTLLPAASRALVSSGHKGSKRRSRSGDAQSPQAASHAASYAVQLCTDTPAVIWTGDFNLTPMSPLYTALLTRMPDNVLCRTAAEALLNAPHRCVSQRLLSGQQALFLLESKNAQAESHHAHASAAHSIGTGKHHNAHEAAAALEAAAADLKKMPLRLTRAYLGGQPASLVHLRIPVPEHFTRTVTLWMRQTGCPIRSWTDACFVTTSADLLHGSLSEDLLATRPPESWACPLNLKSAQALKTAVKARGAFEGGPSETLVEPCYTAFHREQSGCIDYVWYSPEFLSVVGVCAQAITAGSAPCPSKEFPLSDHLPLVIEFEVSRKEEGGAAQVPPRAGEKATYHVSWNWGAHHRNHEPVPKTTTSSSSFSGLIEAEYRDWVDTQLRTVRNFFMRVPSCSGSRRWSR